MKTITFDTLAYVKKLKVVGFTEAQAEVQAEALAETIENTLATKQDIYDLKNELKGEFKTNSSDLKSELIKWMFIFWMGQALTLGAILLGYLKK